MAFIIKKTSQLGGNTVYYTGGDDKLRRWSDDKSEAAPYDTFYLATSQMTNNDGTNGGWTGAVTEEI